MGSKGTPEYKNILRTDAQKHNSERDFPEWCSNCRFPFISEEERGPLGGHICIFRWNSVEIMVPFLSPRGMKSNIDRY